LVKNYKHRPRKVRVIVENKVAPFSRHCVFFINLLFFAKKILFMNTKEICGMPLWCNNKLYIQVNKNEVMKKPLHEKLPITYSNSWLFCKFQYLCARWMIFGIKNFKYSPSNMKYGMADGTYDRWHIITLAKCCIAMVSYCKLSVLLTKHIWQVFIRQLNVLQTQ